MATLLVHKNKSSLLNYIPANLSYYTDRALFSVYALSRMRVQLGGKKCFITLIMSKTNAEIDWDTEKKIDTDKFRTGNDSGTFVNRLSARKIKILFGATCGDSDGRASL